MITYALDTETDFAKDYSVADMDVWHYVHDPRFNCYMLTICGDNGFEYAGKPEDFDWSLLDGATLVSHNRAFDKTVVERMVELGTIPAFEPAAWWCSADCSAYHGYPRSLAGVCEALLGVKPDKSVRNKMKGKDAGNLSAADELELIHYAIEDARLCLKVWQALSPTWPEDERWLSAHTGDIGVRGVPIDLESIESSIRRLSDVIWEAEQSIPWAGDSPVLSAKALAVECRNAGIEPPSSLAKDSDECAAWEDRYGDTYPWVGAMRNWRRSNTIKAKLETIRNRVRPDTGRACFSLKYFGGHTGRFSGGGGWNCVTGDHEILTPGGWVFIKDWDPLKQKLCIWDNGELRFEQAAGKVSGIHKGDIVAINSSRVRGVFTPDHRMIVVSKYTGKQQDRSALDATKQCLSCIPTGGITNQQPCTLSDDEIRVLVATAADGYIDKRGRVLYGFKKPRKIDRMKMLLENCGIVHSTRVCDGITTHTVYKGARPTWLNKGFGPWVLSLSAHQLGVLIEELNYWDGSAHQRSGATQLFTTSKNDATWVMTAAHLSGRSASINSYLKKTNFGECLLHHVYVKTSKPGTRLYPCHAEILHTSGVEVFCPQVSSGAFLVKYRDRIHVTGNCQNLGRGEIMGVNMRSMIKASPGHVFISADSAQIEPRVTGLLAGDNELLDAVRQGFGVYTAFARSNGLWNGEKDTLKKDDAALYQMCKAAVLGLSYGAGAERFTQMAPMLTGGAYNPTLAEAEQVVRSFRGKNPKITRLWNRLEAGMTQSLLKDFEVELPSGRIMRWRHVTKLGGLTALTVRGGKMLRQKYFGAKLLENIVQATARDVLAWHIKQIEDHGIRVCLHIHDEILAEVPEDTAEEALKLVLRIMETPPPWAPGLPLGAEGQITPVFTK